LFRIGRSGSGSQFCGLLGIDKVLDTSDLDVVSGAEREHENRFTAELKIIGVEPRLHMRVKERIVSPCTTPYESPLTYVNPNAPWALVPLIDFILWERRN
jgi:hypothetical protein